MAKKKDNLKGLSMADLEKRLHDTDEKLRSIKFTAEGAKSKNVKESWSLRKQVARVLTAINETK